MLGAVGTGSIAKIIASGTFGLLVGTVGIVPTGEWRATFDEPFLAEGMPLIPVLVGMFVMSELMLMAFRTYVVDSKITVKLSLGGILSGFRRPMRTLPTLLRSSIVGIIVGLMPAAGGTVASFAAYSLARKTSSESEDFGKGSIEGLVASKSANNACSGSDLMTTLVLGVPGSATTGLLLGALTMHGLQVGPSFVAQQPILVYGIIAAAIISRSRGMLLCHARRASHGRVTQTKRPPENPARFTGSSRMRANWILAICQVSEDMRQHA